MSSISRHKLCVRKRNGELVPVRVDNITDRIEEMCLMEPELDTVIDPYEVTKLIVDRIINGIETSKIDSLTAELCETKCIEHPDFGTLASRLIISDHHKNLSKKVGLEYSDVCEALYSNVDQTGAHCPLLSDELYETVKKYKDEINGMIDLKRDFLLTFFGFKTLEKSYLLHTVQKGIVEGPQHLFMRVALGIHGSNLDSVKETYDLLSQKYFVHATPTLYNCGTRYPSLFSCFLLGIDDSIDGIFKCLKDTAQISKWAGGIGIHISNIRARGSYIRKTAGKSDGIVPMLKLFNDTANYVNQGGKRLGSFAMYIEPWHADIFEFLEAKIPRGVQETKSKELFYALWIPDLFMKAVDADGSWYLMCPSECPGLTDVHSEEFENLYMKYVGEKRYRKEIKARELWSSIINTQIETGIPYIAFKDTVNKKSNQKNLGTIKSSNLCIEIMEYSDDKKYACCVLASIVLPTYVTPYGNFDHEKLYKVTKTIVRNLDIIIDKNFYAVPETKVSNLSERPLGIGVQGLADVFFKLGLPYESEEAMKLNKEIFETIYFSALEESCKLAQEKGMYATFEGSPFSQGILQFDMWNTSWNQNDSKWNWSKLKEDIKKYGTRNSLLTALMPTASTSQIMGSTSEAFEPISSNLYTRRTLSGEYIILNKYLMLDLIKKGLWNKKLMKSLVKSRGSVQNIKEIPNDLKEIYKTCWEIKQTNLVNMSADRGIFIDQSQSLNLFFEKAEYNKLNSIHFKAWKAGLKTGSYYIRSKPVTNSESFATVVEEEDDCEMCGS